MPVGSGRGWHPRRQRRRLSVTVRTGVVGAGDLVTLLTPRNGLVAEAAAVEGPAGPGGSCHRFVMAEGPLRSYRRTVQVTQAPGGWAYRQEVGFTVGLPWFSWLFALPLRRTLGSVNPPETKPWWAPPARLDRRGAVALATLCSLSVVVGYLDSVMVQTMTYVGAEYRVGVAGQGVALAATQVSAVLAIAAMAAADRHGRRRLLLGVLAGGLVLTAVAGAAPGLSWLTVVEVGASTLVGAGYLLVFVVVSEEMPARSRAWAAGVLSLCYGLGSGAVLLALPLAGLGAGGWRWVYLVPVAGAPILVAAAATLPETRRFLPAAHVRGDLAPGAAPTSPSFSLRSLSPEHRRRLWVLGAAFLAYALFATPAGQFTNQFLRVERHFSPAAISVLQQVSGTIGGLGVLVGGHLADTWGRRPVAVAGVAAGTAVTLATFFSSGWGLWAWAVAGSLLSYAVTPALAIYGPELFPTRSRGTASGVITALAAAGGVAGLLATGELSSALGAIGPALAVMAVGPAVMVVLVVVGFPETAGRALEDLNYEGPAAPLGAPERPPARSSGEVAGVQHRRRQVDDPRPAPAGGGAD
jgi:putative MFS transporter